MNKQANKYIIIIRLIVKSHNVNQFGSCRDNLYFSEFSWWWVGGAEKKSQRYHHWEWT
jgi:hypothetical protein